MRFCIYGAGGFGREVYCSLLHTYGDEVDAVFMVDDAYYDGSAVMGVRTIRRSELIGGRHVLVAIGNPALKRRAVESLPAGTKFATHIDRNAVVSKWVTLGEGAIVTAGCVLTCNIEIGRHCHLNLGTTVGHDCRIGDYFTTAPGAHISGNCAFGDEVYIGTGASVREKVRIAAGTTVGMGAAVVKDIVVPGVYVGVPATLQQRVESVAA